MISSHFLDSGSFSLLRHSQKHGGGNSWYDSDEMKAYLERYARFVRKHAAGIDVYANVDCIGYPKRSWRNLKFLEKRGLRPLPVVHYGTDVEWVKRYIDEGYDYIGIGGMVASLVGDCERAGFRSWLDEIFSIICNTPSGKPAVRLHGFGVTNYKILSRYPWWSVDSTAWCKRAGYGGLMMPQIGRRGGWDFGTTCRRVSVSLESEVLDNGYHRMSPEKRRLIQRWLDEIEIPYHEDVGEDVQPSVCTSRAIRCAANLLYFERLRTSLPAFPWAWRRGDRRQGFFTRVTDQVETKHSANHVALYFSGVNGFAMPQRSWVTDWYVMTTFWDSQKTGKPTRTLVSILKERGSLV